MLGSGQDPFSSTGATPGTQGAGGSTTVRVQWLYEKPQLPVWADIHSLDLKFEVDQTALVEHLIDDLGVDRLLIHVA